MLKTRQKRKRGHIWGIFGENPPFFGPESCVFEIALVSLVGVVTYEKILRTFPISNFGWYGPSNIEKLVISYFFVHNHCSLGS